MCRHSSGQAHEPAYLDVPLGLLVFDKGSNTFHEVSGVLIVIPHDADTLGRVVQLDIYAEGIEVALD